MSEPPFGLLVLGLYFFPTIVAAWRQHQTLAIGVLNLITGWTIIGWIVALVWACTERRYA